MACTSKYIYSNCSNPTVGSGCYFYTDSKLATKAGAGYYSLTINGAKKKYQTDANSLVISAGDCVWSSTKYADYLYTANKNDCAAGSCTVVGNSVTLNDNGNNVYVTSGFATSNISQADADVKAQTIADNAFIAGRQAKINEYGTCTWIYTNGSVDDNAYSQTYTRNNCAANCYGGTYTTYSTDKSGYYAQSNLSCQDAVNTANAAAYQAAKNEVQAAGQNNANTYASCCCWVSAPNCEPETCNYRGDRQTNTCGGVRNEYTTQANSCNCSIACQGTYYYYDCTLTTRYRTLRYTCNNADAGAREWVADCSYDCGAGTSPLYTPQYYTTCYNCNTVDVYKNTNGCSGPTAGQYFVLYGTSYINVGGAPTNTTCNTNSDCVDTGSPRCSGSNYVISQTQSGNTCSTAACADRIISSANNTSNPCYDPCANNTAPTYTNQNYIACYNCTNVSVYKDTNTCSSTDTQYYVFYGGNYVNVGGQPTPASCNYTSNCSDTGSPYCLNGSQVINQAQGNPCSSTTCGTRVITSAADSSNPCYVAPTCKVYQIVAYDPDLTVTGTYTNCSGFLDSFSFFGGPGTVGTVCAQPSSVLITQGPAGATEIGNCT